MARPIPVPQSSRQLLLLWLALIYRKQTGVPRSRFDHDTLAWYELALLLGSSNHSLRNAIFH
jgi:hypothetical protein